MQSCPKTFFFKSPQGFAEGSVKEYKRAETASKSNKRTLIAAPNELPTGE
jgi:hypothetical protein